MKTIKYLVALLALTFGVSACDNPGDSNTPTDNELITYVVVTLHDSTNLQDSVMLTFSDIDGPAGSTQPVIKGHTLLMNKTYIGKIQLYQLKQDHGDSLASVNEEIIAAGTAHQFFYTPNAAINNYVHVVTTDKDANGLPLGLQFVVHTSETISGDPASGILNVVLSHFEDPTQKNGTSRSTDSDIDIDFPITIQ
jgi:hypothetical protein